MNTRLLTGLERLEKTLRKPIEIAGIFAAWCGLGLVFVVAGNVLARYIFNAGSVAIQEMEWHLISPIALIGMSYAMQQGEHVRVDFLYDRLSVGAKKVVDLLAALLLCSVAVIIVKLSIPYVEQSYGLQEGSPDPGGLPNRWILKAFVPLGFALLALQAFLQFIDVLIHFGNQKIDKQKEKEQRIEHSTHVPS